MPTTRVSAHRCGTDWSGWLDGSHPTVEDGEVFRTVCFSDRFSGCKYIRKIYVKTVDPTLSTNFTHFLVPHATVAQTECEANILDVVRWFKNRSLWAMYFTTYRSPLLIVIVNTIVITWCILANFYVGSELLNVINIRSSNGSGYQISFTSFTKVSENCQIHLAFS